MGEGTSPAVEVGLELCEMGGRYRDLSRQRLILARKRLYRLAGRTPFTGTKSCMKHSLPTLPPGIQAGVASSVEISRFQILHQLLQLEPNNNRNTSIVSYLVTQLCVFPKQQGSGPR